MKRPRNPRFNADGVLVVDKPAGLTSHDVVERLRRRFRPSRLGHAGTLDPFATGVLVLAFNQATRLMELLGAGSKVYQASLLLGSCTDSGDLTGQITREASVPEISPEQAEAALAGLLGPRMQAPPAFSAAKHEGRALYSYARQGQVVEKPARPITVYQASLDALEAGRIDFTLRVSRGTYLRSLGEDLAAALGTVGHLGALCRRASEPFSLAEAASLEQALAWDDLELEANLLTASAALERCGVPQVSLDEELAWQVRQGRQIPAPLLWGENREPVAGPLRVLDQAGQLVAVLRWLGEQASGSGRPYETIRVFPETGNPGSGRNASASALGAE